MSRALALDCLCAFALGAIWLSGVVWAPVAAICMAGLLGARALQSRWPGALPAGWLRFMETLLGALFLLFTVFGIGSADLLGGLLAFGAPLLVLWRLAPSSPLQDFLLVLGSFLAVLGVTAAAPGLYTPFLSAAYIVTAAITLPRIAAAHERTRHADARLLVPRQPERWRAAPYLASVCLAGAALVLGAVLYVVVPRFAPSPREPFEDSGGGRALAAGTGGSMRTTGIPDEVRLGQISDIKRDERIAFYAEIASRNGPWDPNPEFGQRRVLLLRQKAWDVYDAAERTWSADPGERRQAGHTRLQADSEALYWKIRPVYYEGRNLHVPARWHRIQDVGARVDRLGNVTVRRGGSPYRVTSELPIYDPYKLENAGLSWHHESLLHVPPSLRTELDRLFRLDRMGPVTERIMRLHSYLQEFRYTLRAPEVPPGKDPVIAFLERKEGHCELFATAGVMLLRRAGIPARLAGGMRLSERIGPGRYVAHFSNAHAWVEVPFNAHDFVALDFTPPDRSAQPLRRDAPITPTEDDSGAQAGGGGVPLTWEELLTYGPKEREVMLAWIEERLARVPWRPILLGLLALAVVVPLARRRKGRKRAGAPVYRVRTVPFYVRWLRRCARQGYRRRPQQTPREFLRGLPPDLRLEGEPITDSFESVRYGGG